ncbi:MAG TPA: glycoside hydrolase family 2 TIM barrel-domain containing protein [Terracidiphilus sp.]|nr:glycoside hydrolase family 2 TIM barrel-domain containing protein [Terracidiphilus sp.]
MGGITRRHFLESCSAVALTSVPALNSWGALTHSADLKNGIATQVFSLDREWLFGGKYNPAAREPDFDDTGFSRIALPHCVAPLSWQNWDPAAWEDIWHYRRHFSAPKAFAGKRVFLKFEGVMVTADASINGKVLPTHRGGYLPFTYELTSILKKSGNVLDLIVDSRFQNVPPEGSPRGHGAVDYFLPGGIIRGASLYAVPQIFISDVFAKPVDVLEPTRRVDIACEIDAAIAHTRPVTLEVKLMEGDRVFASARKKAAIAAPGKIDVVMTLSDIGGVKLWDVDAPHLYHLVTTLFIDGAPIHSYGTRIGFREAKFTVDGFFLNGRRLRLFGLNRHEIYPYVGYAMPARVMRRDAEIIRNEFHCNIVRCSHYPQSKAFLDACDELGLMVWEEPPGWGYVGDATFEDIVVQNVGDMIRRDRNHASIVIWGVRVNESRNDQALYRRTTELARSLDNSRPDSGSMTNFRNWQEEWHEDIFSMDDYHSSPNGSVEIYPPLPGVPYMLSETVGQYSYSTGKGFGNLYRRAGDIAVQCKQAIYHAQAHDRAAAYPRFCGVIAWCAFEYGSPDNSYKGVKNPGVADVFRIPKLGASFYQAQVNPAVKPVIVPNFYWDFGSATPRGPGKDAAIFSNCDRLELFVDGKPHSTVEPDRKNYPNLEYAPFFADLDIEGGGHPELRIDGHVAGHLALSRSFSSNATEDRFLLLADDSAIAGDGVDATRLVFRIVDKFEAPRLFAGGDVSFEVTGPGILIGDNPFSLAESGGTGAVWVKALPATSGRIFVKATHSLLGAKSVMIEARPDMDPNRIY